MQRQYNIHVKNYLNMKNSRKTLFSSLHAQSLVALPHHVRLYLLSSSRLWRGLHVWHQNWNNFLVLGPCIWSLFEMRTNGPYGLWERKKHSCIRSCRKILEMRAQKLFLYVPSLQCSLFPLDAFVEQSLGVIHDKRRTRTTKDDALLLPRSNMDPHFVLIQSKRKVGIPELSQGISVDIFYCRLGHVFHWGVRKISAIGAGYGLKIFFTILWWKLANGALNELLQNDHPLQIQR